MIFKVYILFFVSVVFCQNLPEGDRCFKDGSEGVCRQLRNCKTAMAEVKQNKKPQVCSFDPIDTSVPIVCCVDKTPDGPPSPVKNDQNNQDQCEPIPEHMTSPKTGQKAFDKCIDYQQTYVYPCERGTALIGNLERQNNCHHKTDSLIIGGTDADQHEFPHMALLGYGDLNSINWDCGGSIVSERFILTAGHCTYRRKNDPVTYAAIGILRRSETKDPSKVYKVKNIIQHPNYKSPSTYNNIALIETDRVMELSQFIVPACVHTGDYVDDTRVLASGWGNTQGDETHKSEVLQKVIISKFSAKECSKTYRPNNRTMKTGFNDLIQSCYGDREDPQLYQNRFSLEHKDTCEGDSGGPIQIKNEKIHCMYTIVGVISIGRPKCGHKPAIYTRVAQHLSWIEATVWPN